MGERGDWRHERASHGVWPCLEVWWPQGRTAEGKGGNGVWMRECWVPEGPSLGMEGCIGGTGLRNVPEECMLRCPQMGVQ